MSKKCIILGYDGKLILKKEILEHLKAHPGDKLIYKLIPGNRLILESSINSQKSSRKEIKSKDHFELTDLKNMEIKKYSILAKLERQHKLH